MFELQNRKAVNGVPENAQFFSHAPFFLFKAIESTLHAPMHTYIRTHLPPLSISKYLVYIPYSYPIKMYKLYLHLGPPDLEHLPLIIEVLCSGQVYQITYQHLMSEEQRSHIGATHKVRLRSLLPNRAHHATLMNTFFPYLKTLF